MSNIQFSISSKDVESTAAADYALSAILTEGESDITITRERPFIPPREDSKTIDPIALAGLILAIPGAILAVVDLVDRLRKRRKAEALISTAQRLRHDKQVQVDVITAEGTPRALDQLTPDELLEIADKLDQISALRE